LALTISHWPLRNFLFSILILSFVQPLQFLF